MKRADPRLAELSRDMERLAGRLNALARQGEEYSLLLTPALVRLVLAVRLTWSDHFAPSLGEPARVMLLALYAAQLEGKNPTITEVARAAAVHSTTAHRWLGRLEKRDLIRRGTDSKNARLVRLALLPEAVAGVEAYLAAAFERPFLIP